jgi:hypothetical protein
MCIALITPTGARPKQIGLCAKFMKQQDYDGEVLWIIVDDAVPVTTDIITDDFRKGWRIIKLYPEPRWKKGDNTQARNLLAGVNEVKKHKVDAIFIIEDDDYYSPRYLRVMMRKIKGYDVAAEAYTVYYNPVKRGYLRNVNDRHASLFQVAFVPDLLPVFKKVCETKVRFIDIDFFRTLSFSNPKKKINIFNNLDLAIGIKGLPGRAGIGMGHRADSKLISDPNFEKLRTLIGEDYIFYA